MLNVKQYFKKEHGLTLVEILVSIVIMGILIISFLNLFSQSILSSSKVEDRLTAVNIAEKVLTEVKESHSVNLDHYNQTEGIHFFDINNKRYYIRADELLTNELGLTVVSVDISIEHNFSDSNTTRLYGYIEK
ncbi:type IV pilus modification PilV family protein [Bacillus sp. FJAT-45037]|uniref:type IV pilus modification PilV family protein n=1 Tax=Bacillus sp. FJAT-45037 TaxID=2011007 RepID=UPI000C25141C|nr:type II secretion system protein [Bacillus sp. FJAT-45037]